MPKRIRKDKEAEVDQHAAHRQGSPHLRRYLKFTNFSDMTPLTLNPGGYFRKDIKFKK